MSKDIRSFFSVISKKSNGSSNTTETKSKKAKPIIDSDDEDFVANTPEPSKSKPVKRKTKVLSSDSEDEKKKSPKKKAKKEDPKLKPIDISSVFNNAPIKQSKVEPLPKKEEPSQSHSEVKKKKRKKKTELGVHEDEDFEKTLLELDDDILLENVDVLDKTMDEALAKDKPGSSKENSPEKPKENKKRKHESSTPTPQKKKKIEHTDSGIDPDQEAFEKKRYSAMLYANYKNRAGPKHHGQKEYPEGKPDCLQGITFLRTGVLDSLEGEEFLDLVKRHGGRVVHAVSKKVNYLVVGEEPGPAKLEKARSYNIPSISEDEFLDIILTKSNMKAKYAVQKTESSEDLGLGSSQESSPNSEKSHKPAEKLKKEKRSNQKSSPNSEKSDKPEEKLKKEKSKVDHKKHETTKILSSPKKEKSHHKKEKEEIKKDYKITKSEDLPQIERPKIEISASNLSWTEKYKPKDLKSVIGQQGDRSNLYKLKKWLENWHKNRKMKIPRPSPWDKNQDGGYFKCALLSGPPGVGKTTTATLVSQELGLDIVEFNASDTRSKRLLHEEVSQLLKTKTIAGFAAGEAKTDRPRVLLMDEVDGMAGNEDRGGIQELINLIKTTSIPIICMCNDRQHQKMRSLVNYCFDLTFSKPRLEQIRGAMMSICFKEGIKITPNALTEVINGTGCDIRQTLNNLSMWTADSQSLSVEQAEKDAKTAVKDTVLGPWEVVRKVFSEEEQKNMSLSDKSRLFFYDYSLGPLFVQENYLKVTPKVKDKKEILKRVAAAADSISYGDVIDSKIRRSNNWALLESQAMYSSVLPGFYMSGQFTQRINFPGWLGKNSSKNKHKRMLGELRTHTRISMSASSLALKLDYMTPLRNAIVKPLINHDVAKAVDVMKDYHLLREDLDNLLEMSVWKGDENPFTKVETKTKTAFTKMYNKAVPKTSFAATKVTKKKTDAENDFGDEDEEEESDTEDITKDSFIQVKKPGSKKETAGSSKEKSEKTKGKGKGKKSK